MTLTEDNCKEVYFSTISSLCDEGKSDILNLAAKLDTAIFSVWIKPPDADGAEWHYGCTKLTCEHGELFMNDRRLPSLPLRTALLMFHAFLQTSPVPVLLVSHSMGTVSDALFGAIKKACLLDLFHGVIAGFTNLLPIWKENYPGRKKKSDFRLSVLSQDFLGEKYSVDPVNTTEYLLVITKLAKKTSSKSQFIVNCQTYDALQFMDAANALKAMENPEDSFCYRGSEPLLTVVSRDDLKKMARAGISLHTLKNLFLSKGSAELCKFLEAKSAMRQQPPLFQDSHAIINIVRFIEQRFSSDNRCKKNAQRDNVVMSKQSSSSN